MWLRLSTVLVAGIALLTACGGGTGGGAEGEGADEGPILKIGVINSDTGPYAFAGAVAHDSMKVAVEHINADGGIAGHLVELDVRDNASDITQAVTLTGNFAKDSSYDLIIGPTSTPESLAVAPVANEQKMPLLGATVVGGDMLETGPWVFKTAANSDSIMADMARLAVEKLGLVRIAVVYGRENEAQVEQRDAFVENATASGAEIVTDIGVLNKDTNFSDVARQIVAAEPDALFVAMTGDATANVVVQATRGGLDESVQILGTSQSISKEYLTIGGEAVEGTIAATDYSPALDSDLNRRFVADYEDAYSRLPDAYGAMGYQALIMLREALADVTELNRTTIMEALTRDRSFEGVLGTGHTTVTNRVPVYGSAILQITDGEFGPFES